MFDEYLHQKRATEKGEIFRPFDIASDYRLYVSSGKPRFNDTVTFLRHAISSLPREAPTILHNQRR